MKKIKYNFTVHSLKHLYNNYTISELFNYSLYLQSIYFNVYSRVPHVRSSDKYCLVRDILDLEFLLEDLTVRRF